jgi:ribose 5-phosphate isomerase A
MEIYYQFKGKISMNIEEQKQKVAKAALDYIPEHTIIGVGTGSTVNYFIDELRHIKHRLEGAVASSMATEERLKAAGIPVFDLNAVGTLALYVDGADAFNAALTREKILAAASTTFLCIVDSSKETKIFGEFPIPIEVIPMARGYVAREIVKLHGNPVYRQHFQTDNGNLILDIHHWQILEPIHLEKILNNIAGVVTNGIFADKGADTILIGYQTGVRELAKF